MRRRLGLIAMLLLCAPLVARADELAILDAPTLHALDASRFGLAKMLGQPAPGDTRFVLAGIVNRMDRAYVAPETCGEIRLIYRLTRSTQRLPMTLNLVLHARLPDEAVTCADLARRWLDADKEAALATLTPAHIDRFETNLQIAFRPQSGTDYLQHVFRRDGATLNFHIAPMENQIDRDRLLADPDLRRAFKDWLLTPENLRDFDRGTLLIPEQFLATSAFATTPAPADVPALFSDDEVVAALARVQLDNIRSPAGFTRRLSDITCSGCHQTRGIGGFHLPGANMPGGAPGSPHFAGDQLRRRAIVMSMRDGKSPDFSRGFADRPQTRGSTALDGSSLLDGWGAACYRGEPVDASFASWRCAEGLTCQPPGEDTSARIGMCFVK